MVPRVVNAILTIRNVQDSSYHKCDHVSSNSITEIMITSIKNWVEKYKTSNHNAHVIVTKSCANSLFSLQLREIFKENVCAVAWREICDCDRGALVWHDLPQPETLGECAPRRRAALYRGNNTTRAAPPAEPSTRRRTARPSRKQLCLKLSVLSPNPETCNYNHSDCITNLFQRIGLSVMQLGCRRCFFLW